MSEHAVTAIIASLVTLVSAVGVFMARSRLSDVVASPSTREETAVQQMAGLLDKLADFQSQRESRLLDIQEKALETVATMTGAVKEVTMAIQAHDAATDGKIGTLRLGQNEILVCMNQVSGQLEEMGVLLSDLALEIIKDRAKITQEGVTRENTLALPK